MWSKVAAPLVRELHHRADVVLRDDHRRLHVRLLDLLELARHLGRVVHLDLLARPRRRAVRDVRRGDEEIEVELALEPLAHDLHVQEAEEAAAEAEAERLRGLGLVGERPVVQLEALERVAQLRVVVGVGREDPGEDHRLDVLVAGERRGGGTAARRERVADAEARDVLEARDDVADLARREGLDRRARGRHDAELLRVELRALRHRAQRLARREAAVDDAHEGDDAAVLVVRRVEDERSRGRVRVAGRRRDPLDDRVEDLGNAVPRSSRRCAARVRRSSPRRSAELARRAVRVGLRKVDLVRGGDDLEVPVDREVRIRERLRLDSLRRVDDEQRALAGLERARHLVREVDVAGGVDEVELVAPPATRTACALIVMPRSRSSSIESRSCSRISRSDDRAGQLEDAIGERRLAVVDVRDDREVANPVLLHEDLRG